MWQSLGFTASPYDSRPLKPHAEDAELLVGRESEAVEFATTLESYPEGIQVLSGPPGVGKTSFFNVMQYRLSTGSSDFGPHLLAVHELCTIYPGDQPRSIALRAVEALTKSVEAHCSATEQTILSEIAKIARWARSRGDSGFEIGLQIAGFGGNWGRSVSLPSAQDISFEGLRDALECLVGAIVTELNFDGAFVALDNIENLEDAELQRLLITLRDTLFMVPKLWWILIGQSGLGSLIQTLDPRVSDRLAGAGLELRPLLFEELERAVELRVKRFSSFPNPRSPLPTEIHESLYVSSHGEMRFVFRYSHEICTRFVQKVRQELTGRENSGRKAAGKTVANLIAGVLMNNQIPVPNAKELLREIVTQEFEGLSLRPKDKRVLRRIAEREEVRPREYADFGLSSMQSFYTQYISRLHGQHLLARRQQGKAVYYRVRGIAAMAHKLGLLEE